MTSPLNTAANSPLRTVEYRKQGGVPLRRESLINFGKNNAGSSGAPVAPVLPAPAASNLRRSHTSTRPSSPTDRNKWGWNGSWAKCMVLLVATR
ncbi:hypothetical protein OXX59_010281 [Metschnikowia pulcherrima]